MPRTNYLLVALVLLFLGATAKAKIPSYVPTNGLAGWWPFNGNANDESGNDGVNFGSPPANVRFGNPMAS